MHSMSARIQQLVQNVKGQFLSRTVVEYGKHGVVCNIKLEDSIEDNTLTLKFSDQNDELCVSVPLPYEENGVYLLKHNEVIRALSPFWIEQEQRHVGYLEAIYSVIMGTPRGMISQKLVKPTPYLQQVIYSYVNGNTSVIMHNFQKSINEIVNNMPLHETYMSSYVMNKRLVVIDPEFDALSSPEDMLAYQKAKNEKYFGSGWTSLGLSDGSLANKNYILTTDLRTLSPFGIRYHNPQRNLFSTLGMKGDELPKIKSATMQGLLDSGITRKGWNLFTAFVDVPDTFEDQILVDRSHLDKFVTYKKRIQVFGDMLVDEGQPLKCGQAVGTARDGQKTVFNTACESAKVTSISEAIVSVGGTPTRVNNVVVSYKRYFKDGFKFTNLHGNKGIVRFMDLGYATHPVTGERRRVDVIVGAKTVGKRANYGQVMEALLNNVMEIDGLSELVLSDDYNQSNDEIVNGLVRRGFNKDATWKCNLYTGDVETVCGTVFWGVIKTPEDQIWGTEDLQSVNGKGLRTAGLKFSHVEFRALGTIFGDDNPVSAEIMEYMQGTDVLKESLNILRSKRGELPENKVTVTIDVVKPVDQEAGTVVPKEDIVGTIVDDNWLSDGFILHLPEQYQVIIDRNGEVIHEGATGVYENMDTQSKLDVAEVHNIDYVYIPAGFMRRCWRHDTGKFGLNDVGLLLNNLVVMSHRLVACENSSANMLESHNIRRMYFNAISTYFGKIAASLGTKKGHIANYGMAVRFPFSVKATAALSTTLPKNTVEIHRSMAKVLGVNNGDIVLAERFPCLGFVSVRVQKVRITDDPMCMYTIRASGNSLVSQNLDFDGDTLYLASFKSPEAKLALAREFNNPNITYYKEIEKLNNRKGGPSLKAYKFEDFNIKVFSDLTKERHADLVEMNTGVKSQTGPVIALTYNLMRIVENSDVSNSKKIRVGVEMFLEKTAQSVFEQKHGGRSLYEVVMEAVCKADLDKLIEVGFKRSASTIICRLIKEKAAAIGVFDLNKDFENAKKRGKSNIVTKIVRAQNIIYFASRASLEGLSILRVIEEPAVDVPSRMFKEVLKADGEKLSAKLGDAIIASKVDNIKSTNVKELCVELFGLIDTIMTPVASNHENINSKIKVDLSGIKGSYNR